MKNVERMQAAQLALIDYAEAATRPDRRQADIERRAAEVRGLLEGDAQAAQLALIDYAEAATRPDRRQADIERRAAEVRGLLEGDAP